MSENILLGGLSEIEEIKSDILELNKLKEIKKELDIKERQTQVNIAKKENDIANQIKHETHQPRVHLEAKFDELLDNVKSKLKKVEHEREKQKKAAMVRRIDVETADFRNEDEALRLAGKSVFKQESIPLFYNNRLFFALYFPKGLGDIGIVILSLAIAFFVIPFGLYTLLFEGLGSLYLGISYIIAILFFGGIYLIIGKTKYKHLDALHRVREMRKQIYESKKRQHKIKREIEKEKDDSFYGLEDFDQEIREFNQTIEDLVNQKHAALKRFDEETAVEIKRQIVESTQEALNEIKQEFQTIYQDAKNNLEHLNQLSVKVSTQYETILGKEFIEIEKLDLMANEIQEGRAQNIAEAKALLSQNK